MKTRRLLCALLLVSVVGSALAHDNQTPAYRPPLLMTVHDAQMPGAQCAAAAIKSGEAALLPLTLLAAACATWTDEACELWVPQTGIAALWSVASSLMSPDMILGHEATHCWMHDFHGALPWF